MTAPTKRYLGDGVYADVDDACGSIVLTTEDGIRATNTIYLEPEVIASLLRYIGDVTTAMAAGNARSEGRSDGD